MNVWFVKASKHQDLRGGLAVFDILPFTPVRAFVIHDTAPETARGHHAHRQCTQGLIAAHGSVSLFVTDGDNEARYMLNHPGTMLVVPPGHWLDLIEFSPRASLVVLADMPYDESDYIRDFTEFATMQGAA
jgi:UDP-2-acetamido-3-amino-2,3-dideoxy-glucuronate N-acetyltransferase